MKIVKNLKGSDFTEAINEAKMARMLTSEELVKSMELYNWEGAIYIIFEYMDRGSMTNICLYANEDYSE